MDAQRQQQLHLPLLPPKDWHQLKESKRGNWSAGSSLRKWSPLGRSSPCIFICFRPPIHEALLEGAARVIFTVNQQLHHTFSLCMLKMGKRRIEALSLFPSHIYQIEKHDAASVQVFPPGMNSYACKKATCYLPHFDSRNPKSLFEF